jgi:hypothetical protein
MTNPQMMKPPKRTPFDRKLLASAKKKAADNQRASAQHNIPVCDSF